MHVLRWDAASRAVLAICLMSSLQAYNMGAKGQERKEEKILDHSMVAQDDWMAVYRDENIMMYINKSMVFRSGNIIRYYYCPLFQKPVDRNTISHMPTSIDQCVNKKSHFFQRFIIEANCKTKQVWDAGTDTYRPAHPNNLNAIAVACAQKNSLSFNGKPQTTN